MVSQIGSKNTFEYLPDKEIIDTERPGVEPKFVKFLHPEKVEELWTWQCNPMKTGYPVDPATVPRRLYWEYGNRHRFPDVDMARSVLLVSQRVRDTIEKFEPGIHQFLPVDVFAKKNPKDSDLPVAKSFWLAVGQRLDSVSVQHSRHVRPSVVNNDGKTLVGYWDFSQNPTAPIIFDQSIIEGHHMWVDVGIMTSGNAPFLSDELGAALKAMNLVGAAFGDYAAM